MNAAGEGDPELRRGPALQGSLIHVRIPKDRVLSCDGEPLSGPAIVEALKAFMAENSTVVIIVEIRANFGS